MKGKLDLLLYVITEKKYSRGRPLEDAVALSLRGGASVIQLRDKDATTRELVRDGNLVRRLTRDSSALFIVNDRVDVALAVCADGVHLGRDDMPPLLARKLLGPDMVIGRTVRTPEEAVEAESLAVDYVAAGSIFESGTKKAMVIGLSGLRSICGATRLPVVAIGGITLERLEDVFLAGASGAAVSKGILDADDVEERTRSFRDMIKGLAPDSGRRG